MNDEKKTILIVDDSPDDIHILVENLKDKYAILAATSGEKALDTAAKSPKPNVILLDVSMPGLDGYETCRRLQSQPSTKDIDVIFVSANDTIQEKLNGYEAGGVDYLIKPVESAELLKKIALVIKMRETQNQWAQQNALATQTAMTAISNVGEQGIVIDFMRRSFGINTIPELLTLIVEAHSSYGLSTSAQARAFDETYNISSSGPTSALEKELLFRLKDSGRIKESGARLIANFGDLSLLIKNMPEDNEKRGRYRDHLALILEGAEARLKVLLLNSRLNKIIADSNDALSEVQKLQQTQKKSALEIMAGVLKNLEASFMSYGLTEEQEKKLIAVVQQGVEKTQHNFEQGLKLDEQLKLIVTQLGKLC
ncbi:MAG: response regulator [Gammaproteobacteria bacterium]|nr:response regulator [Gammaproteobacteria bacterium]